MSDKLYKFLPLPPDFDPVDCTVDRGGGVSRESPLDRLPKNPEAPLPDLSETAADQKDRLRQRVNQTARAHRALMRRRPASESRAGRETYASGAKERATAARECKGDVGARSEARSASAPEQRKGRVRCWKADAALELSTLAGGSIPHLFRPIGRAQAARRAAPLPHRHWSPFGARGPPPWRGSARRKANRLRRRHRLQT